MHIQAGSRFRIPSSDGGTSWWMDENASGEQLVLAIGRRVPTALEDLVALAERAASEGDSAEDSGRRVRRFLAKRIGAVQELPLKP